MKTANDLIELVNSIIAYKYGESNMGPGFALPDDKYIDVDVDEAISFWRQLVEYVEETDWLFK